MIEFGNDNQPATEILLDCLDPRKIILQLARKKLTNQLASYQEDARVQDSIERTIQEYANEIMTHYQPILVIRETATKILSKDRNLVDSAYAKTALQLRSELVKAVKEWLDRHSGKLVKVPFDQSVNTSMADIKKAIQSQVEFIAQLENGKEAQEIRVAIQTHNAEIKDRSRDDNGEIEIKIDKNGKIVEIMISEKFSYTSFANSLEQIPIMSLAKYFPDEMISKFTYSQHIYATQEVEGTKVSLSYRLHDYSEEQFWLILHERKKTTNNDFLTIIQLWLEIFKKYPRVFKN